MKSTPRCCCLVVMMALTLPVSAIAADPGKRKSGLWEIKTSQAGAPEMTMQICIDEKQDDLSGHSQDRKVRQQCSKIDAKRTASGMVIDSVCEIDKTTAISHVVITGDLASQYRMDSTTRFDPPLHGMAQTRTSMSGRWLGACKPGQKHGSMTMMGMPANGQFKLDPDTIRQMQKLQQQYAR